MYVDNYIGPILATNCSVIVGCDIEVSDVLGVCITQCLSIVKRDDCHWPAAWATGNELFVSIKRKVHPKNQSAFVGLLIYFMHLISAQSMEHINLITNIL